MLELSTRCAVLFAVPALVAACRCDSGAPGTRADTPSAATGAAPSSSSSASRPYRFEAGETVAQTHGMPAALVGSGGVLLWVDGDELRSYEEKTKLVRVLARDCAVAADIVAPLAVDGRKAYYVASGTDGGARRRIVRVHVTAEEEAADLTAEIDGLQGVAVSGDHLFYVQAGGVFYAKGAEPPRKLGSVEAPRVLTASGDSLFVADASGVDRFSPKRSGHVAFGAPSFVVARRDSVFFAAPGRGHERALLEIRGAQTEPQSVALLSDPPLFAAARGDTLFVGTGPAGGGVATSIYRVASLDGGAWGVLLKAEVVAVAASDTSVYYVPKRLADEPHPIQRVRAVEYE